ncbi:phenylalanine--tRNA ligase subunit beta [Agriterribacter sp.]|uniref:phenylalanine--tRNA ligase subunit beta n=1 Tax=Agriterribacter sp. TaxID=2821509 RepID=UPI002BCF0FB3|nr:phenylalanine--tRNA ligase subunit beta [Agriterribacter sp.]HTN08112.1 phenylalanine--tRNA ligase subunit beta [Agriterribacter sp.]
MTISYNWLREYLPVNITPEKLAVILTSLGLEVENFEQVEDVKGSLEGLVIGEVLETEKHPNADKLRLTRVDTGAEEPLQIVCGAPNVAAGQKVVVAPVGVTIYPSKGQPLIMKVATIRGTESYGMICAEDELGLGDSHDGIMVLRDDAKPGTPAADYFRLQSDWIYEIGLTPNRMDAMSHLGVAKDICAYLSVHDRKDYPVKYPYNNHFKKDRQGAVIEVKIENQKACERYSGVLIENVTITESPEWLKRRIRAVGLRPISNIVDITNFILHETGQPLHAFDADQVKGNAIIVKNLPEGTPFITLDEKERKLHAGDLMICNGNGEPMCFGGVFGGLHSGVTAGTKNIFIESAWFNPVTIRKTSFRHNLRTDAAARFEKGTDISNTVTVLKRAALLIKELAGGTIASDITDVYPDPKEKKQIILTHQYLKKLSGKSYPPDTVKTILTHSGFEVIQEDTDKIRVAAPFSKPDIELPADIVEEIMRIDGYDNVAIPGSITISPSVETIAYQEALKEKIAHYLAGNGFNEIFTNAITNSAYFDEATLRTSVKMLNSLSAGLNIMRPSMLETGLECLAHNINRKNNNLRLFEFGKTYHTGGVGQYKEKEKLCLYITGMIKEASWKAGEDKSDFYYLKGIAESILHAAGLSHYQLQPTTVPHLTYGLQIRIHTDTVITLGLADASVVKQFDIKQQVWYAEAEWEKIYHHASKQQSGYTEIPRFPAVQRDLAIVVDKQLPYEKVEQAVKNTNIKKLQAVKLFDVFESDKLGAGKKSFAINLTFLDNEKTLTDNEIDGMMQKIMHTFEQELPAEIRK